MTRHSVAGGVRRDVPLATNVVIDGDVDVNWVIIVATSKAGSSPEVIFLLDACFKEAATSSSISEEDLAKMKADPGRTMHKGTGPGTTGPFEEKIVRKAP
ncbi:hypothetical protein HPB47_011959 [Ixodes persulcatus]|uniref:Uncharacterized protein n=1 Tax=Ixodes persulcatus TaxID=34615 RepID=A0AC60NUW2_IXOPE|nr:hypothetical protein HPB47_011959 [Ixodes persulcatus]